MESHKSAISHTKEYDYLFKYIIVGSAGTGKTSLMLRYADDIFTDSYIATIGVDFKTPTGDVDGKIVKRQIWDTSGQEKFRTIVASYYRGSHAVILVVGVDESYNPSNSSRIIKDSDEAIKEQLKLIASYANQKPSVILVINGTDKAFSKAGDDASKQRRVQEQLAKAQEDLLTLANSVLNPELNPEGIAVHQKVFLTSAKNNVGINELFDESAKILIKNYPSLYRSTQQSTSPFDDSDKANKKGGFFKSIWNGVYGLLSAIVGGVVGCVAHIAVYNPLALTYSSFQKAKWFVKPLIILISPLMVIGTLIEGIKGLFKGSNNGWNNGITGPFIKVYEKFVKNDVLKHAMASWLVLSITAAVVLAVLFPPAGLALWLPTMAATMGLSGVSTAVLAVIAGAATIAIGSLVYGLTNLTFGGNTVKAWSADKSTNGYNDKEGLLDRGADSSATAGQHPAAASGLAGGDVSYANPIGGAPQPGPSFEMQNLASVSAPVLK